MTAKEMFEALGFKRNLVHSDTKEILATMYVKEYDKNDEVIICFVNKSKTYRVENVDGRENHENIYATSVGIETHQAITQQMKELGWIE
jgi:hypothetical protein